MKGFITSGPAGISPQVCPLSLFQVYINDLSAKVKSLINCFAADMTAVLATAKLTASLSPKWQVMMCELITIDQKAITASLIASLKSKALFLTLLTY